MTLTFNPWRATVMTHTGAEIKVRGQLVLQLEWNRAYGRAVCPY